MYNKLYFRDFNSHPCFLFCKNTRGSPSVFPSYSLLVPLVPCGVFGGFRVIIDKHFVARVLILTRQNVIIKKKERRKSWHSHFVTWFNPSTTSKISKRLVKEPHTSLRDQTTAKPGGFYLTRCWKQVEISTHCSVSAGFVNFKKQ